MSRRQPELLYQYSMEVLHLKNARPQDMILASSHDATQSPAVFANYGEGYLSFIGDVNAEEGTTALYLSMCGVKDFDG